MNQGERLKRFFVVASAIWPDRIVRPPSAKTFRVWARIGASLPLDEGMDELLRQAVAADEDPAKERLEQGVVLIEAEATF